MINFPPWVSRLALIGSALLAARQAQCQNFVVTGDNENGPGTATVFELSGSNSDAVLRKITSLQTGGMSSSVVGNTLLAVNRQVIAKQGSSICLFVSDSASNDVAAFKETAKVGNYSDSTLLSNVEGISMAALPGGKLLYAAYPASLKLAVWQVSPNCSLTLVNTVPIPSAVDGMRVTPNGMTLVVTYESAIQCTNMEGLADVQSRSAARFGTSAMPGVVPARNTCPLDTFAISGTTLTEKGPFSSDTLEHAGVDITRDSKFAIVGVANFQQTIVEAFPIEADGTLGKNTEFTFPNGMNSNNVWLSPNEKFLYVSNNESFQVTTLNFTESPLNLTFDCIVSLNNPQSAYFNSAGISTEGSGAGSYLYVAETGQSASAVGLLSIDSTTGCLTEDPASPFPTGEGFGLGSLSAYPGRTF